MPKKPPIDLPLVARPPNIAASTSQLKFPRLVKPLLRPVASSIGLNNTSPAQAKCNQDEDQGQLLDSNNESDDKSEDEEKVRGPLTTSRRGVGNNTGVQETTSKAAAHAKNRDFIKELEEKKRREREEREKKEQRRKKQHDKSTQKILQGAALKKNQKQAGDPPASAGPEHDDQDGPSTEDASGDSKEDTEEERERKERARKQQKMLLKKQQQLFENLKAKKREKDEELEQERERERKRQEKVTRAILNQIQEANNKEDLQLQMECEVSPAESRQTSATVRETSKLDEDADDPKRRANKEQQDAMKRKQQEYLAKLADQRKQKQREEDEARIVQERKKKKIQQEAAKALQEAARRAQQEQEVRERQLQAEQEAAAAAAAAATPVDVEAMVARLSRLKEKDAQVVPEARDFASWKKRHGVRSDQKVFIVTGCYPVIREELEKRGWYWNQDRYSPFFDLKWALKSDDLKTGGKLEKHQYVNHFAQNTAMTTKVGLLHSLRRATEVQSFDCDTIFPRAYDLNEPSNMDAFVQDFRLGVAEGLLKQLVSRFIRTKGGNDTFLSSINQAVLDVVLSVARKKVRSRRPECDIAEDGRVLGPEALFAKTCLEAGDDPLDDMLDDDLPGQEELVTDLQWEILNKCAINKPGKLRESLVYMRKVYEDDKTGGPDGESGAALTIDTVLSAMEKKQLRRQEKRMADSFNREKARLSSLAARVEPATSNQLHEAERLARALNSLCPQFRINGGATDLFDAKKPAPEPSQNVWIVKPAGLSRGRGIRVFNNLDELLGYADVENHKECQWVSQKYIENPLLACRRKFDIRQWVLVTCWDPLTVYMHGDCYLRFSSEEYSTADLSDQYVHLTNNSIQKYSDKFNDVYGTDDGDMLVEGNMWHSDEFQKYLRNKLHEPDVWDSHIRPAMRAIIVRALQCVQDRVAHRKNACELFGYDFMIDGEFTPWLIEVNSSPACDYSTPTAERYVTEGLAGIVKVIVDLREFEENRKKGSNTGATEPDIGCWKRIHRGEYIGKPVSSFGADFQVRGSKLSRAALRQISKEKNDDGETTVAGSEASTVTTVGPSEGINAREGDQDSEEELGRLDDTGNNNNDEEQQNPSQEDKCVHLSQSSENVENGERDQRDESEALLSDDGGDENDEDEDDEDDLSQSLEDSLL